jgi:hypothetical protein
MAEFHIHVDAMTLAPEFEEFLTSKLAFWRSDFGGHPEGQQRYEPVHHLTQEPRDGHEFRAIFDEVVRRANVGRQMTGYIEGEYIPTDIDIDEAPYDGSVKAPLRVSLAPLPSGRFRESEIHITLDRDRSEPGLIQALTDIGLYSGFIPKAYGIGQVMTVQGSRTHIAEIEKPLLDFLRSAGGGKACSLKEERVIDWWVSESEIQLPPVIDRIDWPAR